MTLVITELAPRREGRYMPEDTERRALRESIARIGEIHLECERQFLEFEAIVPYKYNGLIADCLYSPRLYNTLQGISSGIDSIFKVLLEAFGEKVDRDNMDEYLEVFDKKGMLSKQAVVTRVSMVRLQPFLLNDKKLNVPPWWTANNKTKHHLHSGGARYATLGNTIQALAAFVILLHISRRILSNAQYLPSNVLDEKNWQDNSIAFQEAYDDVKFGINFRYPIPNNEEEEKYLISKDYDFRSRVFYYTMRLNPPKSVSDI